MTMKNSVVDGDTVTLKIESIDVYVKNIRNLGNGKYSGEVHGFEPFNPAEFKNLKLGDVVEFKESEIFSCSNH
ncbi:putative penicillin-binding protein A [Alicycliphilus sp. B1]|nr:putative penicillin-binding protein A [Alicycliphilus sp. B1]